MGRAKIIGGFVKAVALSAAGPAVATIRTAGIWHFNEGTGTVAHDRLPTTNDVEIGDYPGCSGLGFSGRVDQVRVFNRALEPLEISMGYQLSGFEPSGAWGDLIR